VGAVGETDAGQRADLDVEAAGVSLSAHVYADGWDRAAELGRKRRRAPQDARGNVVVEPLVEQGVLWLRATWLTPAGEALGTVKARTDRDLLAGIRRKRWVTGVDHALWLGAEVARVWQTRHLAAPSEKCDRLGCEGRRGHPGPHSVSAERTEGGAR